MEKYHKIKTLWKRESEKSCNMIIDEYALPEFELLKDLVWIGTEKVDGTNVRVMWNGDKVKFGGKTDNAQMPIYLIDKLNEMFGGETNEQLFEQTFEKDYPDSRIDVCLYGEGYGAKIQKGGGNYGEVDFVLFDVKIGDSWLQREDVEDIAEKLGVKVVPIVFRGTLQELSDIVATGFNSKWGMFEAEGIVARPRIELKDRKGNRIITKLKYKDFVKLTR